MDENTTPQEILLHYLEEFLEKGANLLLLPIKQRVDYVNDAFAVL